MSRGLLPVAARFSCSDRRLRFRGNLLSGIPAIVASALSGNHPGNVRRPDSHWHFLHLVGLPPLSSGLLRRLVLGKIARKIIKPQNRTEIHRKGISRG